MTSTKQPSHLVRKCNKCGSTTTSNGTGSDEWYTDPTYTSQLECHKCYSEENIKYFEPIRYMLMSTRIKTPRSGLRKRSPSNVVVMQLAKELLEMRLVNNTK